MASKKYSLLTGVLCLLASYGFSQVTYDVMDSSVVRSKDMDQYTKFKQGIDNYPAKPRNQWELGIKTGLFNIFGDVPSTTFTAPNVGLHVRKAFGYLFSARLEYVHGTGKGLAWQPSQGYRFHGDNPWQKLGYTGTVFYNYKTEVNDLSLEGVFSLNNIRFHKSKTGVNFYALAGVGGAIYDAKVDALNGSTRYDFSSVPTTGIYKNRKDIRDQLKKILDGSYETPAESHGDHRPKLFGQTFKPVAHFGAGVAFKLSNKVNLALEDRFTVTNDDLLDGQRWAEEPGGSTPTVLSQNFDTYNFASVGLNINLGSKAVQPLWWINPLDYAYQEIRKPKYMILPKPVLPDADGDGITDQFDQEQTPQGCPVDSHGVSLDTDGDGVPDCRDKEKVTPTYCQPVDADGVGKCPCPDSSCFKGMIRGDECAQLLGALPSVTFSGNTSTALTNDAKGLLASIAARLRQNAECKVVVTSYCSSTKAQQQRAWDRVNVIIRYMVEKEGISGDRFYWQIGQEGGDCNTVDFRAATDQDAGLPTTVPNPNLGRGK